jgi:hypothetical protein
MKQQRGSDAWVGLESGRRIPPALRGTARATKVHRHASVRHYWYAGALSLVLLCLSGPQESEAQTQSPVASPSHVPAPFALSLSEDRLSLEAADASVIAILHEIGRQAGITSRARRASMRKSPSS